MLIARVHRARLGVPFCCAAIAFATVQPGPLCAQSLPADESLEEIVVTARKRTESLFEVPMSVQVLTGTFIDTTNTSTLLDLQFDVPGLVITNAGMFGGSLSLRGVTDQGGGSLAVAAHLDGVSLGSPRLAMTRVFDVERIEVLKGPQGTLYGRNSTGGSINIVSRRPGTSPAAALEIGVGSFGLEHTNGHVALPIGQSLVRFAVAAAGSDGYIRNVVDERRFARDDFAAARLTWEFAPSDELILVARIQHVDDRGGLAELWMPNPVYLPDPRDPHLTRVTHDDPFLHLNTDNASLEVEYDIGELTLHSVTGYAHSRTDNLDDCAGLPFLYSCVRTALPNLYEQWSQEIRLQSTGDAQVEWLAGLLFTNGDDETNYFLTVPAFGPVPRNDQHTREKGRTVAAFGQATWRIGDAWRLTTGARIGLDHAELTTVGTGMLDSPVPVSASGSWNGSAWKLGADYTVGDSGLLFANVATGYKSGGFVPNLLEDGELDQYGPEHVLALEAGVNLEALAGRGNLRAAAFYNDFTDLQVSTTVPATGGGFTAETDNASKARIYGLDATATMLVGERWSISAGAVWLPERRYLEFVTADGRLNVSGNYLSRAPELSATVSIDYRYSVAAGTWSARLDGSYRSRIYFTRGNLPEESQDDYGIANLYLRFDARSERWYVYASGRNLVDEAYFTQVFLQSSVGMPRNWEAGFGLRY